MRHAGDLLTTEIAQMNLEIRAGTPRDQALVALADRTGVADLRSLVTMLIQTERFGTSIADSLRVHAETMRQTRQQRAEEAAAKTTIKMVFPLAICIFPALFVVILGPALIQIISVFGSWWSSDPCASPTAPETPSWEPGWPPRHLLESLRGTSARPGRSRGEGILLSPATRSTPGG
jgi:hypothetical protein